MLIESLLKKNFRSRQRLCIKKCESAWMKTRTTNAIFEVLLIMVAVLTTLAIHFPGFAAVKELSNAEKKQIVHAMYQDYKKSFPDVPDMEPQTAMQLMQAEQVVFVDDRGSTEREVSTLPGAITPQELLANVQQYRGKIVVSYCTISYRSAKLTRQLRQQGLNAYNLAGGLLAWVLEGGRVYDANGESRRIHVYGKRWNYPADGYQAVW